MLTFYFEGGFAPQTVPLGAIIGTIIVSLLFPIALYLLRSIGLYKLAKNQNIKKAWISFIPCVWIYIACLLVKETRFWKSTVGKMAIIFTIVFTVSALINLVCEFLTYYPLIGNYLLGREIVIISDAELAKSLGLTEFWVQGEGIWVNEQFVYPYKNPHAMITVINIIYYASSIIDIFSIIAEITVLFNLFKKYWPSHHILAFIMSCFFGLTGIFIFVIRNKKPINYNDYMRARYNAYYGPYGYRGPNNHNGYNGQNNYNDPYGNERPPKSPFEQYQNPNEKEPEEPFGDYDDKK